MSGKMQLGIITGLSEDLEEKFEKIAGMGLTTCQVGGWELERYNDANVKMLKDASARHGIKVTSIWAGCAGPGEWNFVGGPATIGLVPPEYREMRVKGLKAGANFAAACGISSITTHCGFIPESISDPLWEGTVAAIKAVGDHCKSLGLWFNFETGQETPVTLLRVIKTINSGNLGVNIDPANLLMYGKANPVDALDILGPYVKGVHAKDGEYPTDPDNLGVEKPLGEGRVNFSVFIAKLKSFGYEGALTIEREISGPQQIVDIKRAIELLTPLL